MPDLWVVDCRAVGDGQQALGYLARYLYRGVISARDILRCKDGQVTYRWRDAKTGRPATQTVPGAECLWVLLQHVLPKGFQRARNFGFLHHNCRHTVQRVQLTHRVPMPSMTASSCAPRPVRPVWRCVCGQPMVIVRRRVRADAMSALSACTAQQMLRPDKPNAGEVAAH